MVHAGDRDAAIDRLRRALDETEIAGIQTTLPFHRFVARSEPFRAGDLSTGWVGEHWDGPADVSGGRPGSRCWRPASTRWPRASGPRRPVAPPSAGRPAGPARRRRRATAGGDGRWRRAARAAATDRWPA